MAHKDNMHWHEFIKTFRTTMKEISMGNILGSDRNERMLRPLHKYGDATYKASTDALIYAHFMQIHHDLNVFLNSAKKSSMPQITDYEFRRSVIYAEMLLEDYGVVKGEESGQTI